MANTEKYEAWTSAATTRLYVSAWAVTLVLVSALNFLVDPFDLYGTGIFEPWQFNRYERKLALFENYQPGPEILIMGSSRVEAIDPETVSAITGKRCFNWAQPSASAETILAVIKLAVLENNAPLDTVIVAVDPLVFHPSGWIHPQARMVPAYTHYFSIDPTWINLRERLSRLLTYEQTRSAFLVLRRTLGLDHTPARLEYRTDGFALYHQREAMFNSGDYDLEKILDDRVPVYAENVLGISAFSSLSPERKTCWEEFLDICKQNNIRVYAFIPPMHPRLLDDIREKGLEYLYEETAEYVGSTVSEAGGVFRNYMDIESFGGDPSSFWDEVHMKIPNGEALLIDLLGTES